MILETDTKKVKLVYRTKKIVDLTEKLGGKNFEEVFFSAVSENNVKSLSEIILAFAENPDNGLSEFSKVEEVYDFIDEYMLKEQTSYQEIFERVANDINEMGFFNKKMSVEELRDKINNHLTINVQEIAKNSIEKAIAEVASEEMKISRG